MPGIGLHAGGTASAGELSQTAYVHLFGPTIGRALKNCGGPRRAIMNFEARLHKNVFALFHDIPIAF